MSTSGSRVDVVVVGVANVDLIVRVPHLPAAGQTAFGSELMVRPGGKGLNQALAVAAHGGRASLVARVGDDPWGQLLYARLLRAGVDLGAFRLDPAAQTGAAIIQVPDGGDSAVTLALGGGCRHRLADLAPARSQLATAAVTVIQLELDPAVIAHAVTGAGGLTIGTLAPLQPLPGSTFAALDVVVVNAAEAGALLGTPEPQGHDQARRAAEAIMRLGPAAAVITLGAQGAAFAASCGDGGVVPATEVPVVDTTGAGDMVLGVLALSLARQRPLAEAVVLAVRAASDVVQHLGANS